MKKMSNKKIPCIALTAIMLISVVTAIAIPASATVQREKPIGVMEKIQTNYDAGKITFDEYILYKTWAVFSPSKLPSEYQISIEESKYEVCGTPIILEIQQNWNKLSPDTQTQLEWVWDRPVEPGGGWDGNQHLLPSLYGTTHFMIHYTNGTDGGDAADAVPLADANANGIPDYVEDMGTILENVWNFYINRGYHEVPSDAALPNDANDRNPDDRYDCFLYNLTGYANGYAQPEQPTSPSYSHIALDNDFQGHGLTPIIGVLGYQQTVGAHEFFHGIQFYYNRSFENLWWMEATTTYMEDEVYPNVNKNYYRLGPLWGAPSGRGSVFEYCDQEGLESTVGLHEYSIFIWAKRLSEDFGDDIIRDIWVECQTTDALTANDNVLIAAGSSLINEFNNFTVANYFLEDYYVDGADYRNHITVVDPTTFDGVYLEYEYNEAIDGLPFTIDSTNVNRDAWMDRWATDYITIQMSGATPGYKITFDGLDITTNYDVSLAKKAGGVITQQNFVLDADKNGTMPLPYDAAYTDIVLIIRNSGDTDTTDPSWRVIIEEASEEEIAIMEGLKWLRTHQNPDGSWTYSGRVTEENVGLTSMATLSFLNYGIDESDPTVRKAIDWIISKQKADGSITNGWYHIYDTSLATLALAATRNSSYYDEIQSAVNFLVDAQNDEGEGLTPSNITYGGWGYAENSPDWSDLSNSQFVLLALHYAEQFDPDDTIVPASVWSKAEIFVTRCQNREASNPDYSFYDDGGFIYQPNSTIWAGGQSYASITTAGLWGLYTCGVSESDGRVQDAWGWIQNNYYVNQNYPLGNLFLYYYLYGLAKACILWDVEEINGHDWYDEMSDVLVNNQQADGHWPGTDPREEPDNVATCWALLALISKQIPPGTGLSFEIDSPADLHVYDPEGRHVGINYDTGVVEIEIPGATYSGPETEPQVINISNPIAGTYTIRLVGRESGTYTYTVRGLIDTSVVSEESFTGSITPGEVHESTSTVSALAGAITVESTEPTPTAPPPAAARVPALTPIGIIALAGLLAVVAVSRIRKKK